CPSFAGLRYVQFSVLLTCPASQKPGFEHAVMAVDVQMSKISATAPPCREPDMLHSSRGTVRLKTVRELCGLEGVGSKVADSRVKILGNIESCPCGRHEQIVLLRRYKKLSVVMGMKY